MSTEGTKLLHSAKLLNEFRIGRFRGLDDVSLQQIGLVNLLVGGNNSGKTSVLEALGVFANPLDIAAWSSIARNREVRSAMAIGGAGLNSVEAIRWLFPQRVGAFPDGETRTHFDLSCIGDARIRELHAECTSIRGIPPEPPRVLGGKSSEPSGLVEDEGWLVSAKVVTDEISPLGADTSIEVQLWPSVGFYRGVRGTGPHMPAVTLAPYSHRNQPLQLRKLSELIESNQELDVVELLRDLDADVLDLKIVTDRYSGAPSMLVNHRRSGSVPVSVLGDGFRRALAIALSIPQARGGLLLIDEIETAMFVSFLQTLFAWLVRACEAFDVQLFATTHSLEAVTALVNAVPGERYEGVTAFHLSSSGEPIKRYSSEMLTRLVRDRGLDIR